MEANPLLGKSVGSVVAKDLLLRASLREELFVFLLTLEIGIKEVCWHPVDHVRTAGPVKNFESHVPQVGVGVFLIR